MPARKLVSDQQLEILVSFMEENRDFAVGKVANHGPHAKQNVNSQWELLAAKLNAVGVGTTKTTKKWRDYWAEQKCGVRKRAQGRNKHAKGTGGGPPIEGKWNPIDDRILSILGKVAVFGNPSVRIPFNDTTESPDTAPTAGCSTPPLPHELPVFLEEPEMQVAPIPAAVPPPEEIQAAPIPPAVPPPPRAINIDTSSVADRSRIEPMAPRWALQIEERRVAAEERMAVAFEAVAAGMNTIATAMSENTRTLAQIAQLLERMYNVSSDNQ